MSYCLTREVDGNFDDVVSRVVEALKSEGFGVLTEIDVAATLKAKIGVDFRKYRILGACNPGLAHKALSAESDIGVMLPCNVVVQEHSPDRIEIAAIDPVATMARVGNPALEAIAGEVRQKLERVVAAV